MKSLETVTVRRLTIIFMLIFFVSGCGILPPPDPNPRESAYHWHKAQRVQDKILEDKASEK